MHLCLCLKIDGYHFYEFTHFYSDFLPQVKHQASILREILWEEVLMHSEMHWLDSGLISMFIVKLY